MKTYLVYVLKVYFDGNARSDGVESVREGREQDGRVYQVSQGHHCIGTPNEDDCQAVFSACW